MKVLRFTCSSTLWSVLVCCWLFLGGQWTQAESLWLGNDMAEGSHVFQTTTTGGVITELPVTEGSLLVTGIAWDGSHLYFADSSGYFTKRTADGSTVLDTFTVASNDTGEDLAWDSNRKVLWRIVHYAVLGDRTSSVLQEIDPATKSLVASFSLPSSDSTLGTLGGLGIAYDSKRDVLYVSFCSEGCTSLAAGLVDTVDPKTLVSNTVVATTLLFRTTGFATGGLAYDPATDTLWVGSTTCDTATNSVCTIDYGVVVRHMTLGGAMIGSPFARPQPGGFVDGLEFTPTSMGSQPPPGEVTTLKFNDGTAFAVKPPAGANNDTLAVTDFVLSPFTVKGPSTDYFALSTATGHNFKGTKCTADTNAKCHVYGIQCTPDPIATTDDCETVESELALSYVIAKGKQIVAPGMLKSHLATTGPECSETSFDNLETFNIFTELIADCCATKGVPPPKGYSCIVATEDTTTDGVEGKEYRFIALFPDVVNNVPAGSELPIAWILLDADTGSPVNGLKLDPAGPVKISYASLDSCTNLTNLDLVFKQRTTAATDDPLINIWGFYLFQWETNSDWTGKCRVLGIDVGDHLIHTVQVTFK